MAQKVEITLIDDLDGKKADETVVFTLDGQGYEVDLSEKNAKKLREGLEQFVKAGRKTAGKGKARKAAPGRNEDTAKIREWAKSAGFEVNDRGRVPASIREAYEKANG